LNPQLRPLIDLQTLDLRMAEIKDSQRKLPVLLETAQAPLNDVTKQLADLTAALDTANKEKRSFEKDLEAHDAQTEKMRARLSELKTNKEYQAHLFEIEMANKKKGEIEERVLLCMERIEQHQKAAKEAQAKKAEAEKLFTEEKSRLDAQQAALTAELADLEKKHKEAAVGVEKNLLARYTKLKASRKDQALAPVRNGICFGCKLQLPPQLVAQVRRGDTLLNCNYCHRMLYWEGEPVVEPAVTASAAQRPEDEAGESV
jgi:predicted  nucleic acid-binding Zn-ribbon protein